MLTFEMEHPQGAEKVVILRLKGNLDEDSSNSFCEKIERLHKEGETKYILLDLAEITKIEEKIARFLAGFSEKFAKQNKGAFGLFALTREIHDTFLQLQLEGSFEIFADEKECAEYLQEETGARFEPKSAKMSIEDRAADTLALDNPPDVKPSPRTTQIVTRSSTSSKPRLNVEAAVQKKRKSIQRQATARYYHRMTLHKSFPLVAVLSAEQINRTVLRDIKQTPPAKLKIIADNPRVEIVPHIPGALVVPDRIVVDATPPVASGHFWVTPLSFGDAEGWIEFWHGEEKVQQISLPIQVKRRFFAKFSAACALLSPIVGFLTQTAEVPAIKDKIIDSLPMLENLLTGWSDANVWGVVAGVGFFALAMLLMWFGRARDRQQTADIFEV